MRKYWSELWQISVSNRGNLYPNQCRWGNTIFTKRTWGNLDMDWVWQRKYLFSKPFSNTLGEEIRNRWGEEPYPKITTCQEIIYLFSSECHKKEWIGPKCSSILMIFENVPQYPGYQLLEALLTMIWLWLLTFLATPQPWVNLITIVLELDHPSF